MDPAFLRELGRIVGPEHVAASHADRRVYAYDASTASSLPGAVVFPADAFEISRIVRASSRSGVAFVPRGYGTNLSGGSIAPDGGLVIAFSRLNRILSLEPQRRRAVAQPGVTNLRLQDALAPLGFFFAPDPASQKVSSLGGNVAENSGGPRCLKYGVTTNHVLGLEVVLADGEIVNLGGPDGDAPGLDLRGFFIGSEGTFGLATRLDLRILPRPEAAATALAVYDDIGRAARSVAGIIAAGLVPTALEMMDQPVIQAVEDSAPCGYPRDAAAVLIIEIEGFASGLARQMGRVRDICLDNGCREFRQAASEADRDRLWAGRRGAFGAIARLSPHYLVTDCTVPRTRLPEALERVAAIAERHGIAQANVFHAGDGNLHPLLLFDAQIEGASERAHEAGREIMAACVALGGTITGEHGVGLEKREAMSLVFSDDDLSAMARLKQVLDPAGRLNPGKILPSRNEAASPGVISETAFPKGTTLVPEDEAQAVDMVRWALDRKQALLPLGGGHRPDFGNLLRPPLIEMRAERLNRLLEYDPENQTVAVGVGMKLSALQTLLAEGGQWLPIRPVGLPDPSLGALASLGWSGPDRLAYGAPRDLLLGLRFVSGQAHPISSGGRVMKNVAGYDLARLLCGSAGTLGFLTALTFRVAQRPEAAGLMVGYGSLDQCRVAATALLVSNLAPAFIVALPASEPGGPWRLEAGFEGEGEEVGIQAERALAVLAEAGLSEIESGSRDPDNEVRPWSEDPLSRDAAQFVLSVTLPLDRTADFVSILDRRNWESIWVDLGCGRVLAGTERLSVGDFARLGEQARSLEGRAMLVKAPTEFKAECDVFGPKRPEWDLLQRAKQALDPASLFSPGRLPGRV